MKIAWGTIWPKPDYYHVPLDPELLDDAADVIDQEGISTWPAEYSWSVSRDSRAPSASMAFLDVPPPSGCSERLQHVKSLMSICVACLVIGASAVGSVASGQKVEKLTPALAHLRVGQMATVCGTVVAFGCAPPDRTTVLKLADTPDATPVFGVAISGVERLKLGLSLEDRYYLRSVCVTGTIAAIRGGYGVSVTADQLRREGEPPPIRSHPDGEVYGQCDEGVQMPKPTRSVMPQYSSEAMRARIQGSVVLRGVVEADGSMRDVQVLRSLDPDLDEAAVKAFEQWRFQPGIRFGKAVPVVVTTQMGFTLQQR